MASSSSSSSSSPFPRPDWLPDAITLIDGSRVAAEKEKKAAATLPPVRGRRAFCRGEPEEKKSTKQQGEQEQEQQEPKTYVEQFNETVGSRVLDEKGRQMAIDGSNGNSDATARVYKHLELNGLRPEDRLKIESQHADLSHIDAERIVARAQHSGATAKERAALLLAFFDAAMDPEFLALKKRDRTAASKQLLSQFGQVDLHYPEIFQLVYWEKVTRAVFTDLMQSLCRLDEAEDEEGWDRIRAQIEHEKALQARIPGYAEMTEHLAAKGVRDQYGNFDAYAAGKEVSQSMTRSMQQGKAVVSGGTTRASTASNSNPGAAVPRRRRAANNKRH